MSEVAVNTAAADALVDDVMGVYVHWPFCAQKCPYCDFNSHVRVGGWDEAAFLDAYLTEIASIRQRTGPRRVSSIFFGGGTPSLMQADTVARIITAIGESWDLEQGAEVTLEANPGSVDVERFRGYRAAGVNRVSVGVQALRSDDLRRLGRVHTVDEARRAVAIANDVFDRVSFDLIYAREGQTLNAWEEELAEGLALAAGHLSLYQLTIEPGTPFARWHAEGRLTIPDDDLAAGFFELTQQMTEAAGLPQYETSNHARRGEESRHNLIYWRYQPYVGVGPGAHGRLPIEGGGLCETATEKAPETWADRVLSNGHGIIHDVRLDTAQMADEMTLMGLRLAEGLNLSRLQAVTGAQVRGDVLADLSDEGFVSVVDGFDKSTGRPSRFLKVTEAGRFILDRIVLRLSSAFVV
ncbi:MAG: radical SAM family heme chaperone HemW [Pseudomonadota bacterium]